MFELVWLIGVWLKLCQNNAPDRSIGQALLGPFRQTCVCCRRNQSAFLSVSCVQSHTFDSMSPFDHQIQGPFGSVG